MTPKRKSSQNQRISTGRQRQRQHVLEVKLRTSKERARRFNIAMTYVLRAIVVGGCIAGAWFGGRELMRRFVWENPDYFLSDVRFATDGTLTREQVMIAGDIVEGKNIFTVDLAGAHDAIARLPQVESVEVQRLLPNRVTINIVERRPVAWVTSKRDEDPTTSDRSFLIDARGIVMRNRVRLPEYVNLPVIAGVETENLAPGQRVNAFEVEAALELVRLTADSTRFPVRHVDVTKRYCLVVASLGRARITFGIDDIDSQLARLYRIMDAAEQMKKELRTVNLILTRNTPATFFELQDEAQAEPVLPRDARPPKTAPTQDKLKQADRPAQPPAKSPAVSTPPPRSSRSEPAAGVKKSFRLDN
jgi:cell division septal protein FtsQ